MQYGGLFCASDDVPLLCLTRSLPPNNPFTLWNLPKDSLTFASLAHLYEAGNGVPCECSPEAIPQPEHISAATARGLRDIKRGSFVIKVPHLCVPWGRQLGEVLWRRLGVKLERWGGSRMEMGAGVGLVAGSGDSFWPQLKGEASEYNEVVFEYLENKWGRAILSKVANFVRLSHLNQVIREIQRHLMHVTEDIDNLNARIRRECGDSSRNPKSNAGESTCLFSKAESRRGVTVEAIPVCTMTSLKRYIVNGTLVPCEIFGEFSNVMKENYGIKVVRHSLSVHANKTKLNTHLRNLGHTWTEIYQAAVLESKRRTFASRLEELQETRKNLTAVEDQASAIRKALVDKAIQYECIGASLTKICALEVAKHKSDPMIAESYKYMPREIWRMIDKASQRLKELEEAEPVSLSSFALL